jgi:hypothetical protein
MSGIDNHRMVNLPVNANFVAIIPLLDNPAWVLAAGLDGNSLYVMEGDISAVIAWGVEGVLVGSSEASADLADSINAIIKAKLGGAVESRTPTEVKQQLDQVQAALRDAR